MGSNKDKGTLEDRFWWRVDKSDDCWIWTGYTHPQRGYGQIGIGRRDEGLIETHRLSYELANGPIPEGMMVLHSCDVRACVNPDHLRVGTHRENMDDMVSRGRNHIPSGVSNGNAKLTTDQVEGIREQYSRNYEKIKRGWRSNARELARQHGITEQYVSQIARGKWRVKE